MKKLNGTQLEAMGATMVDGCSIDSAEAQEFGYARNCWARRRARSEHKRWGLLRRGEKGGRRVKLALSLSLPACLPACV